MPEQRDGTKAVHAGLLPNARDGEPILPGPTFASPYHLRGDDVDAHLGYGRYGNPTWKGLERAIGKLNGGAATLVFPSGSAAIAAVMMTTLEAGATVVVQDDSYPTARHVAERTLARLGVDVRLVPTVTETIVGAIEGASLVLVETPSNPGLNVVDIAAIAAAAKRSGAVLVVDNTLATPLGSQPLELGAEAVVLSGSKHLTGHNDLLLGSVSTRDEQLWKRLFEWRTDAGAILGPFEAWLAHRSLATLDVRLERQCANALALAELLAGRTDVAAVRYPGLAGDPSHALAKRQMSRFGSVLTFDLTTAERANRFLAAAGLILEATSFGGVHTTAERRARWKLDAVSEGLIRLSAGIEDVTDLAADVEQALNAAS